MARKPLPADPAQLGFEMFLAETETINNAAAFERTHGHFLGTMEEALPFYRDLIRRHHTAMLAADIEAARPESLYTPSLSICKHWKRQRQRSDTGDPSGYRGLDRRRSDAAGLDLIRRRAATLSPRSHLV